MTQVLQSSVSLVSVRPRNPSISSDFDDENNPHHVYFGHKKPRNSKSSIQSTNGNKKNNNPTEATNENDGDDRAVWSSRLSFLLSSISFAVDLTTVFRFPYLCYIHGGGAFLIAYLAMLIFCAVPVFYMELLAGQYFRQGCVSIWKLAILFKGIGWASVVLIFFASLYYNAFIAWSFFYFFASFIPELPWEKCNHWWNTVNCQEQSRRNISLVNSSLATAAREFFEIRMLGVDKSSGFNDYGSIQWEVCGCMFLVNLLLFLSLFKGVKVLEKVSWITACVPYLAIAILLIRGLTLENAFYGIKTFLNPSFGKLLDWDVWFAASSQAFFSLGVGFGVHLAYGSYNQVDHPAYVDCILTTTMNAFISILNSITLYSFMGYLSKYQNVPLYQTFDGNLGLIFMAYTSVFSTLSLSHLWCILLFSMLVTLGLGSSIGATESFLTAVCDEITIFNINKKKYFREGLTFGFLSISFLLSIPNACQGGYYLVQYLDQYTCGTSLLVVSLFQCFAIVYVYGIYNLSVNLQRQTGQKIYFTTRFILKFCVPLLILFMLVFNFITADILETSVGGHVYTFPRWSLTTSWFVLLAGLLPIPINMICQYCFVRKRAKTFYLRMALLITPPEEQEQVLKEGVCPRLKWKHWLKI